MTDDLVKRLRNEKMGCNLWCEYYDGITTIPLCIEAADRIKKLEAALLEIADGPRDADKSYVSLFHEIQSEARKALEGKDG